jgi:hypothetical protein
MGAHKGTTPNLRAEILPCPVPFLDEERHLVIIRG